MVVGFAPVAVRRLLLGSSVTPGTDRVLMGTADRGVDVHVPGDRTGGVRPGLQPGQDRRPDTIALPAPEEPMDRLPRTVRGWQIPPRGPDPHPPADPVDQPPRPAAPRMADGLVEERLGPVPFDGPGLGAGNRRQDRNQNPQRGRRGLHRPQATSPLTQVSRRRPPVPALTLLRGDLGCLRLVPPAVGHSLGQDAVLPFMALG